MKEWLLVLKALMASAYPPRLSVNADIPAPTLCANSGLMHRKDHHSKISSARPDRGSGTVMPSALAVLRFKNSSTLADCWTGRSAGFSPLRIRPA
jgi:hypothetical protein